jgi:hypothetical protein
LAAEEKYGEAEKLLTDGYQGLAEREATIPANSKTTLDQAAEWTIQLYQAWGKPERAAAWRARLVSTRAQGK